MSVPCHVALTVPRDTAGTWHVARKFKKIKIKKLKKIKKMKKPEIDM